MAAAGSAALAVSSFEADGAEPAGNDLDGRSAPRALSEHRVAKIESRGMQDRFPRSLGPDRRLPWLTWGPYIWDNTWDPSYFTDGVHPAPKALEIFIDKYWQHLSHDSVAKPWLFPPAP